MKKTDHQEALKERIYSLEFQKRDEFRHLKKQFHITYEGLKPLNILKSTFQDVTKSSEIKSTLINSAIGIATGYLSKKVLVGSSHNPIKRIFGTILEFVIANVVTKKVTDSNHQKLID